MSNLEDQLDREAVRIPVRVGSLSVVARGVIKKQEPKGLQEPKSEPQAGPKDKPKKLQLSRKKIISIIIFTTLLLFIAVWLIPVTRNFIVNTLGLRTSFTVITRELQTSGAVVTIKNTTVRIDGTEYAVKENELTLNNQTYGGHEVEVSKNGYAPYKQKIHMDFDVLFGLFNWYDPSLLIAELKLTGTTITFVPKSWVGGKPINAGEYTVGDRTARPGRDGSVTLVAPPNNGQKIPVSAHFDNDYLDKTFEIDPRQQNPEILFIPGNRHYFVQRAGGLLNVYSSYADTSDKKVCVPGTPDDTDIQFAVRMDGKYAVMVSTREGIKDETATKLQKIYWVNLSDCSLDEVDAGHFVTLFDWIGDSIAYTAAYRDPKTVDFTWRLKTLDTNTKNNYELAKSSGFIADVTCILDTVIFTKGEPAGHSEAAKNTTLHTADKKGGEKRELASNVKDVRQLDKQRVAYNTADGAWSEININTGQIQPASASTAAQRYYLSTESRLGERIFIESTATGRSLVVEKTNEKARGPFVTETRLSGPIRFLNSYAIVYRVGNTDYIVSTLGGDPKKLADIAPATAHTVTQFPYN